MRGVGNAHEVHPVVHWPASDATVRCSEGCLVSFSRLASPGARRQQSGLARPVGRQQRSPCNGVPRRPQILPIRQQRALIRPGSARPAPERYAQRLARFSPRVGNERCNRGKQRFRFPRSAGRPSGGSSRAFAAGLDRKVAGPALVLRTPPGYWRFPGWRQLRQWDVSRCLLPVFMMMQ